MAGKTLVRFWQVALKVDAQEQVQTFKTEVEFIASVLSQIGNRIFLASKCRTDIEADILLTRAFRGILPTALKHRQQDVRGKFVLIVELFLLSWTDIEHICVL